ncbi:unnamed protein product, partial [Polarella glacialis]
VPMGDYIKGGYLPADDLPSWIKPYYDGVAVSKKADGSWGNWGIAAFAQKRAAYYLTQGCAPFPTKSCGTQTPEIPAQYVGESLFQIDLDVAKVPWHKGMTPQWGATPNERSCVYDPTCSGNAGESFLQDWVNGCDAGGKTMCRFCGSGDFPACPKSFDCADGLLHKGLWSEDQRNWCCKHYSMGCPAPHECLKDIETWKDSWSEQKKSWCCNYQSVGCPNECSKMDPLDWSENHHFWCGTFGKTT